MGALRWISDATLAAMRREGRVREEFRDATRIGSPQATGAANHEDWKQREAAEAARGVPLDAVVRSMPHPALDDAYPLLALCHSVGLPLPRVEHRFARSIGRQWRFDYAWIEQKLALEIDGGLWINGRHSRGSGRVADMEKLSEAAILGWRVIYATPDEARGCAVLDRIRRALAHEYHA